MEFRFFDSVDTLTAAYREGELDAASGLSPEAAAELSAAPDSRLLRYPASTLTSVLLNQRPTHPEFRSAAVRTALFAAIDREALVRDVWASMAATAPSPIPPSSWLFDAAADPLVPYSPPDAEKALKAAGWSKKDGAWYLPGATKPLAIEVVSPQLAANPTAYAAAAAVVEAWRAIGLTVSHLGLPPRELVMDRLTAGSFGAAVTDINLGLDPDLYPLLASSQTQTGASNVAGVQDVALDKALVEARKPGTDAQRRAAYSALQTQLGKGRYLLPLAFQDELVVYRDGVSGPLVRQVADRSDRFWDVLTWRLAADR